MYRWSGDGISQIESDKKFTLIGTDGGGLSRLLIKDMIGKVWTYNGLNNKFDTTGTVNPGKTMSPAHSGRILGHSGKGSVKLVTSTNGTYMQLSVDSDGRAWVNEGTDVDASGIYRYTTAIAPTVVQGTDGIEFFQISASQNSGSSEDIYLLGKPRNNTASYVAQMPTSGAPEGLSLIGLLAVGLCLMGLIAVSVRRNRV
ncbi:hypothetical protein [Bifidobacterium callitrichidarum]|uniref:hypothetical protein n=1 Tax=Bifidobacterium callitrichidarum TaxID=2052941 RepID=UPI0011B1EB7E|nr:hypothetical protein [Bifidobacterium callitrichidarum]